MRTSRTEVLHLALGVVLVGYSFAAVITAKEFPKNLLPGPWDLLAGGIAVASAFIPHELAHKIMAQRYGYWAEFRAELKLLPLSLFLALGFKMLFAAPGAVVIHGQMNLRNYAVISVVGPAMNLVIGGIAWPFALAPAGGWFAETMHLVVFINGALAIFNLIPAFVLDGRKIWWYSKTMWAVSMAAAIAFMAFAILHLGML